MEPFWILGFCFDWFTPWKFNSSPLKMDGWKMSFLWDSLFSGAMLNFGGAVFVWWFCMVFCFVFFSIPSWIIRLPVKNGGWNTTFLFGKVGIGDVSWWSDVLLFVWFAVRPGRLTWTIIMEVWKIIFLCKWVICRFHVNLPECMQRLFDWFWFFDLLFFAVVRSILIVKLRTSTLFSCLEKWITTAICRPGSQPIKQANKKHTCNQRKQTLTFHWVVLSSPLKKHDQENTGDFRSICKAPMDRSLVAGHGSGGPGWTSLCTSRWRAQTVPWKKEGPVQQVETGGWAFLVSGKI